MHVLLPHAGGMKPQTARPEARWRAHADHAGRLVAAKLAKMCWLFCRPHATSRMLQENMLMGVRLYCLNHAAFPAQRAYGSAAANTAARLSSCSVLAQQAAALEEQSVSGMRQGFMHESSVKALASTPKLPGETTAWGPGGSLQSGMAEHPSCKVVSPVWRLKTPQPMHTKTLPIPEAAPTLRCSISMPLMYSGEQPGAAPLWTPTSSVPAGGHEPAHCILRPCSPPDRPLTVIPSLA